jgi:transcriptional antiterminator NusG
MPILKFRRDLFPADLFELSPGSHPWTVAHVRSRQEKALARYLEPLGVPFFLPQREHRIRRAGRKFISFLPLFPGYVFLRGGGADRLAALRSNLIVRTLRVDDQELLHAELRQLRELQQAGASFVPLRTIAVGDVVRVSEGAFQGYSGIVIRVAGRLRLVVSISMLRKSVAVEFERESLVPVVLSPKPGGNTRSAVA